MIVNDNRQLHQKTKWPLRIAIGLAVALLATFSLFPQAAQANGGPHGNYTATTDKCAGCHRAHTGSQSPLLIGTSRSDLCLTCHGTSSGGSNTNVLDGRYTPTGAALNGGGFNTYQGSATTSRHNYDGSLGAAWGADTPWSSSTGCLGCHSPSSGLYWGGIPEWYPGPGTQPGQMAGAGNVQMALGCTSCHDPHGARSYRLLQNRLHPATIEFEDPTLAGYVQVVSNETGGLNPDQIGYVADYTTARYRDGITSWCSGCHMLYQQTQTPVGQAFDAADGNGAQIRYRHKTTTGVPTTSGLTTSLPLQQPAGYSATQQASDKLACITCHYAHGTSATMAGYAGGVAPTSDSALLRRNNRGVCEDCHKK
ncbi:MAG: cytochrome c3 family protein [Chloroflexi bacterium]|nr:cytochrome c3 family protein [Chloroflexota bacterium]